MRYLKVLALGLLILGIAVPVVGAQVGTWTSSFSVINLGGDDATIEVNFYTEAGVVYTPTCLGQSGSPPTCDLPNPFVLGAGEKAEINLSAIPDTELPAGNRYSVVISANQAIAAVGSLLGDDNGAFYSGSYTGVEDMGQTTIYLPGVQWSFYAWYSHLSIQNITGSAQDVDIFVYEEGSDTVCFQELNHNIQAYSSYHLDLEAEDLSSCDTVADFDSDGVAYNGGATVVGASAIAVVDNQTTDPSECAGCHLDVTYEGFLGGSDMIYLQDLYRGFAPIGHTGWNSSINVQNVGATDADVTVTIAGVVANNTLAPSESWLIYLPSDMPTLPVSLWTTYAATIETADAADSIVAIGNAATPPAVEQAMTYNATTAGGGTVAVPTLFRDYYGWNSSFVIQNLGGNALTPEVCYAANANPYGTAWAGDCFVLGQTIAPGESLMFYQGDGDRYLCEGTGGTWNDTTKVCTGGNTIPATYLGGATVTISSGAGPMAGVVNATQDVNQAATDMGDWSMSFNTINQ
jgi:hypothetical protein